MRLLVVLVVASVAVALGIFVLQPTPQFAVENQSGVIEEIDVAVSYLAFEMYRHFGYTLGDESCSEAVFRTPIPDHTVYDENGDFHDALYMIDMSHTLMCRFGELNDYFDVQERAMEILQGRSTPGADGILLDADQQSVRVFAIHIAEELFRLHMRVRNAPRLTPIPTNETEACAKVRDIVRNGVTTELRYAAFRALIYNQIGAGEESELSECFEWLDDPDEVLIERAKAGDLDAALTLGHRETQEWRETVGALKDQTRDLQESEQEQKFQELSRSLMQTATSKIEDAASKYPLLALAHAYGSQSALAVVLQEQAKGTIEAFNQLLERYKELEEN